MPKSTKWNKDSKSTGAACRSEHFRHEASAREVERWGRAVPEGKQFGDIKLILTRDFSLAMVSPLDNKAVVAATIGNRIRGVRLRLQLTLQDLATASGVSKPFLSQVERGMATPSIVTLSAIAKAMGVTLQYFVETQDEEQAVFRRDDLKFFGFAGSANQFGRLTNSGTNRLLDAQLVRMPAGETTPVVMTSAVEEFMYVMSGEVSLTLEGRTFVLQAGDTAHYESSVPHAWVNTADEESVFVWVGTPKLF